MKINFHLDLFVSVLATLLALAPYSTLVAGEEDSERGMPTDIFWVGDPGDGCSFTSLQDAIAASSGLLSPATRVIIRLAPSSGSLVGQYLIDFDNFMGNSAWHLEELHIVGGYETCNDSQSLTDEPTVITVNPEFCCTTPNRPLLISYHDNENNLPRRVVLRNLELSGGQAGMTDGGFVFHGGGLEVSGQPGFLSVSLVETSVRNNQSVFGSGGGIFINSTGPQTLDGNTSSDFELVMLDDDSIVENNSAEEDGGGIYCRNAHDPGLEVFSTRHLVAGNALIMNNTAENGGGISSDGCRMNLATGGSYTTDASTGETEYSGGIIGNTAANRGGGLHLIGGSRVRINGNLTSWGGDPDSGAWIYDNQAFRGGGIYASDPDTYIDAIDLLLEANQALPQTVSGGNGGAAFISLESIFTMGDWPRPEGQGCTLERHPENGHPPLCSGLLNNHANNQGGAIYANVGGQFAARHTRVKGNNAGTAFGTVSFSRSLDGYEKSMAAFVNSLITANIGPGHLMYGTGGGNQALLYSTMAGNLNTGSLPAIYSASFGSNPDSHAYFIGSVIHDEEASVLSSSTPNGYATVGCSMGHQEISVNAKQSTVDYYSVVADPEFNNPVAGDFRPSLASPLINYCNKDNPSYLAPNRDLNNYPRDVYHEGEINSAPNSAPNGIFDLGAFNVPIDQLLHDRFEVPEDATECFGYCGGQSSQGCWCDESCHIFDDCCFNICNDCEELEYCQTSQAFGVIESIQPQGDSNWNLPMSPARKMNPLRKLADQ